MLTTQFIQQRLRQVALDKGVTIRYANESGSRAWGLASTDSDYDVRFIYQYPKEWYLQLTNTKDMIGPIIELDGELDLVGWDIRKVLAHLMSSNAGVIEWLFSPISYYSEEVFKKQLRELTTTYFQPQKVTAHYLGIARSAVKSGYDGSTNEWNLKKYCYFMRPVLAALYVSRERSIPPVEFAQLIDQIEEEEIREQVISLTTTKETKPEAFRLVIDPLIATYFANLFEQVAEELKQIPRTKVDRSEMEAFFRENIGY